MPPRQELCIFNNDIELVQLKFMTNPHTFFTFPSSDLEHAKMNQNDIGLFHDTSFGDKQSCVK